MTRQYFKPFSISAIIGVLMLAGGAIAADNSTKKERKIKAPAAKAVGEPRTCLPSIRIRQTKVHDDYTIDFIMRNGKTYRNDLNHRCPGLGREERFSYKTSFPRLCSGEIITVLSQAGPGLSPLGSCGLNKFQEIELIEEDAADAAD